MSNVSLSITSVPGIRVGQVQDLQALTGVSVILCDPGTTGGVDQRGGAPGTRETDALRPMHLVNEVHAICLAGGSAFGLDAASGVVRFLEEHGTGFKTGEAHVPIVPSAILYDLALGNPKVRPTAEMGYQACLAASTAFPSQGNFGAGTGAAVGKILGIRQATKSGIGTAALDIGGGVFVGALMAVNAFGDIVDPGTRKVMAGTRKLTLTSGISREPFEDTLALMGKLAGKAILSLASRHNTVIGVVATNARLNREETNKVAQMAHNGIALAVRPAHTMFDGDTIFALATHKKRADVNTVGAFAAEVVAAAIVNAILHAESAGGIPSLSEIRSKIK